MSEKRVEELLARYVEHHVLHGEELCPEDLCKGQPELLEPLCRSIERYRRASQSLALSAVTSGPAQHDELLPTFEGFRTIERLGSGGGGEVFKLEDLALERLVAAKVLRRDNPLGSTVDDFLREAKTLALFEDPRIVRIFELRHHQDRPVLFMEYVDGFALTSIGPSLEYSQRARVVREIAEALHRAHTLGIQHRDLKPDNILVDAHLQPRILDFGLSQGDPSRGHLRGTLPYMAPEQLDPERPIDARTDVYALGVILYELLCGDRPFGAEDETDLVAAISRAEVRLPVEIEPDVPEPLQAIALKAMEREPADRYPSARDMALDLSRYLDRRPVLARPTLYQSVLARRLEPHLDQVREWLEQKLIYPHEADHLEAAYRRLEGREDDWIVESRVLSFSRISLYLGAFVLSAGALFYFRSYLLEAFVGLRAPTLVLGLPFLALNAVAGLLYRRDQKSVAVAFYLAAILLLPLFLLIVLRETGWFLADPDDERELFGADSVSNRQLQIAGLFGFGWSYWLAFRTRTIGLSSAFTAMALLLHLAVLTDLDLKTWLEEGQYDRLAIGLAPLLVVLAVLGRFSERRGSTWLGLPLYVGVAGLYLLVLELLALDGRALHHLGLSTAPLQDLEAVSDPLLLDSVAAMTFNGVLVYTAGWLLDRYGTPLMQAPAKALYAISPFAILQPLSYLDAVGEYSRRFDWCYLALAIAIALLSRYRQRKSFYYAGLLNTGAALWLITDHYDWWDRTAWAIVIVGAGLAVLAAGLLLDLRERTRRTT